MAEVATQATEVSKLLRTLSTQVVPNPTIDTIHRVLPEASGTIALELAATSTLLQGQTAGAATSSALGVFQHPIAAALLVTLLIATSPFAQIPFTVREVLDIVGFLPMLLLLQPVVAASVVPGLYALGGLFALDIVLQAFAVVPRSARCS